MNANSRCRINHRANRRQAIRAIDVPAKLVPSLEEHRSASACRADSLQMYTTTMPESSLVAEFVRIPQITERRHIEAWRRVTRRSKPPPGPEARPQRVGPVFDPGHYPLTERHSGS